MTWTVAADVGGTFTDVVAVDDAGRCHFAKLPSTPGAFHAAVCDGIARLLAQVGADGSAVGHVMHGTTVATNAVLERSGPRTGLVTTQGMRDVLEIGRLRIPDSYDLRWTKPQPLARRADRVEAAERIAADGSILTPLDLDGLGAVVDPVVEDGVTTIAISLVNSYVNPEHEQRIGEWLRARHPGVQVTVGTDLVRDLGEFERTSTAVLNAYLKPVVSGYLTELIGGLRQLGIERPPLIMQSNAGMMPLDEAREAPVHILESGPAAGALAAARVAADAGFSRAIAFDMGGTTAKSCLIEDGEVLFGSEFDVGSELSAMSRLVQGGGYTVRLPSVDLAEVGAGGGSIARADSGGALLVGPESAGAAPGPACYGRGGDRATVTDANALLGYLSPAGLARGGITLDLERAATAVERDVASPLGLSVPEAAHAIHLVADRQMARAIRAVSTERGRDVSDFVLIVFGGSGPLHAASLAESVGVDTAIVPPLAGLLSAVGLLWAPVQLTSVTGIGVVLDEDGVKALERELATLRATLRDRLGESAITDPPIYTHAVELRYLGQAFELAVALPGADALDAGAIRTAFLDLHRRTYGHGGEGLVEIVRAKVTATVDEPPPTVVVDAGAADLRPGRVAWFGGVAHDTPVLSRGGVPEDAALPGPRLVDDTDTTVVVPPGWTVRRAGADLILERVR